MRITMEADYAIRILYHLSKENMRCDSGAMAEKLSARGTVTSSGVSNTSQSTVGTQVESG